jgi:hypothetical protein
MPKLSSQSATCWVAELRWAAALGALRPFGFNALRGRVVAGLPPALESFFIASTRGWERGIVSGPESTGHGGSSASVWVSGLEVEVKFIADGANATRVELEHRKFEQLGAEGGEKIRKDVDGGWPGLLEIFKQKAEAA